MSREDNMVVIERDEFGVPSVWCDKEIAHIVKALNDAGIKTVASCSGHGMRPCSIILENGTELIITTQEQARELDGLWWDINGEIPPTKMLLPRKTHDQLVRLRDKVIGDWHDGVWSDYPLHEVLGMSWEEYSEWTTKPSKFEGRVKRRGDGSV